MMYKKSKDLIHNYHASRLITKLERQDIRTRQKYDIVINGQRHSRLHQINSLNYKIGMNWNSLPFHIKEKAISIRKPSIGIFTRDVKLYYLKAYMVTKKV